MKTYKDLEFSKHLDSRYGDIAKCDFDGGYGMSIVRDDENVYDIAITMNGTIYYGSKIPESELKNLTKVQVTKIMKKIQNLGEM